MARRKKHPRPRAPRRTRGVASQVRRAAQEIRKELSHRQCLTWGQIANRIEYAAGEAARAIQNGADMESLKFGLGTAAAEALRLKLLIPKFAREAEEVYRHANMLEKEVNGKGKLDPQEKKKLKSSFLTLRDKAQELMDKGESACPL